MKIVKRISDNVVLFAGDNLAIEQSAVTGDGWWFSRIDVTLLTVEDVDSIPPYFIGSGWTYSDGIWSSTETGDQYMLPAKREGKVAELEAARIAVGFANIVHDGKIWKADLSAWQLISQILSVGSVPEGFYWRDVDGMQHDMTYTDLQALGAAILQRAFSADVNLQTKKASVAAAETAAEIDSIAW